MNSRFSIRKTKGTSPGTPIFTGHQKIAKIKITLFDYSATGFVEKEIKYPEELSNLVYDKRISGIHDISSIEKLGELFKLQLIICNK